MNTLRKKIVTSWTLARQADTRSSGPQADTLIAMPCHLTFDSKILQCNFKSRIGPSQTCCLQKIKLCLNREICTFVFPANKFGIIPYKVYSPPKKFSRVWGLEDTVTMSPAKKQSSRF